MRQCLTWQCFLCPRSSCLRPGVDIVLTGKGLSSSKTRPFFYPFAPTPRSRPVKVDIVLKGLSTAFLLPSPVWLYKKHCLSFITLLPIHTCFRPLMLPPGLQFITFITGHLALSWEGVTQIGVLMFMLHILESSAFLNHVSYFTFQVINNGR